MKTARGEPRRFLEVGMTARSEFAPSVGPSARRPIRSETGD